ncbi:guanine deaminase [Cylindrobasidium torrendii FP15055 ss-10]|uniref:Guanine deaminase n=1 Tax=Cylindrobasidium torrendii FP15055 ss-10 TaxID=1314674 RepID=A0A0D7AXF4_9AGAR|nr:guanine deaminase [Cylindrobasidium torrendii FP15055 ss-10]
MSTPVVYYGSVVNPKALDVYDALPRCLLAISAQGNIDFIVEDVEESLIQQTLAERGLIDVEVVPLGRYEFIMPGFIDTHTHGPQFPNLGSGGQYELLDWLQNVTFPMEAKFSDPEFARRTYTSVVQRVINNGTTACCYYGTLHLEASMILADIIHAHGQRALVGKCNMNRNCPPTYIEASSATSIEDTKSLIAHIRGLAPAGRALVQPVLTPRFAISCTDELLDDLGKLASGDNALHIQTHISENESEIAFTKELFPKAPSYAGVYDTFGLLRQNTILAHGVHLEPSEVELIKERKAGISHCPTSNFNLSSGVAPVGEYLDKGLKVGLGTDVSGGFSPSILDAIRNASIAAKVVSLPYKGRDDIPGKYTNRMLPIPTLLYLATLGGAEVCDMDKEIGSFAPGKSFDALIVDTSGRSGNPNFYEHASVDKALDGKKALEAMLEAFLFCGDDGNISRVYVQGRLIGGKSFARLD